MRSSSSKSTLCIFKCELGVPFLGSLASESVPEIGIIKGCPKQREFPISGCVWFAVTGPKSMEFDHFYGLVYIVHFILY